MEFRRMLVEISRRISEPELQEMKFVCSEFIPKRPLEEVTAAVGLWEELKERGKLGEQNLDLLRQLLAERSDLLQLVAAYAGGSSENEDATRGGSRTAGGNAVVGSGTVSQTGFEREFEIILDNISVRSWRPLARHLGVTDMELDAIVARHPADLREQVHQALRAWGGRETASREGLMSALKDCRMNLTVHRLQERINPQ